MRLFATSLITACLASGCVLVGSSAVRCTEGRQPGDGGSCVLSASFDGGIRTDGSATDAAICGEACTGETPRCHPALGTCVGCVGSTDCAPTQTCDDTTHRCADCTSSSECGDTTPICAVGACRGCADDDECATRSGEVCDEATGRCGACTVDSEATRCPGATCHPSELTCSGGAPNSRGFCEACVSDHECASSPTAGTLRCVAMTFGSDLTPHGSYCLLDLATYRTAIGDSTASCPPPRFRNEVARSTLGVEADYCFIRYTLTTCEAVRSLGTDCTSDAMCGDPALADGLCSTDDQCTYPCAGPADCISGSCTGIPPLSCE